MKAKTNAVLVILAMLAYFGEIHTASAFYDPGTQRWLNRDPFGESGFEESISRRASILRGVAVLNRIGDKNLYGFVRNRPTGSYDLLGLAPGTPTGPGTLACTAAIEQLAAADAAFADEPSPDNELKVIQATLAVEAACAPPPVPPITPNCPSGPPWGWNPPPPNPAQQCGWFLVGVGLGGILEYAWVCVLL